VVVGNFALGNFLVFRQNLRVEGLPFSFLATQILWFLALAFTVLLGVGQFMTLSFALRMGKIILANALLACLVILGKPLLEGTPQTLTVPVFIVIGLVFYGLVLKVQRVFPLREVLVFWEYYLQKSHWPHARSRPMGQFPEK